LYSNQKGSAYAIVLFFVAMFFAAFVWFFFFSSDGIVTITGDAMSGIVSTYNTDNHALYSGTSTFVSGISTYILFIVVIGLFMAGIVYTIRKRAEDPLS
jgi:hypothetical protein